MRQKAREEMSTWYVVPSQGVFYLELEQAQKSAGFWRLIGMGATFIAGKPLEIGRVWYQTNASHYGTGIGYLPEPAIIAIEAESGEEAMAIFWQWKARIKREKG